jgi:hypothetical protein
VDENVSDTGALTVILNCLVALASSPVTVIENVVVVSLPTALTDDHVILPLAVFKVKPVGKEPVETEYGVAPTVPVAPTKSAAAIVPELLNPSKIE